MSFTDDDLKRLQTMLDPKGMEHIVGWSVYEWRALIARLEAAEAVCQSVVDNGDEPNFSFSMKAWRKAAGK